MRLNTRRPPKVGIDSILDRRLSGITGLIKIPSSQKSDRSFRSSFSIHASACAKIKGGDLSACNIPKPHRYSFRSTDTKSQIVDSANVDKYTVLKEEYEGMKDELAARNTAILNLQREVAEVKARAMAEKQSLLAKLQDSCKDNQAYTEFQAKIDEVVKENEELAKRLHEKEIESKQMQVLKNQEIKQLNKMISRYRKFMFIVDLKQQLEADKENKSYHSNKYKSELASYKEKFQKSEANLKNRIKLLEMELAQQNEKNDLKVNSVVTKLKAKLGKISYHSLIKFYYR